MTVLRRANIDPGWTLGGDHDGAALDQILDDRRQPARSATPSS